MTPETAQQVLHTIGLGVEHLRQSLVETAAQVDTWKTEANMRQFEIERLRAERKESETAATAAKAKSDAALIAARAEIAQMRSAEPQAQANVARVDRLSLGIWNLIEDLGGRRDAAKTKAEAKALGHVIAALQDLYGPRTDGKPWAV